MIDSCIIDMRGGERSDASISVLPTRIAISPCDDDDVVVVVDDDDDDDDYNELAWGRGARDKDNTLSTLMRSGPLRVLLSTLSSP